MIFILAQPRKILVKNIIITFQIFQILERYIFFHFSCDVFVIFNFQTYDFYMKYFLGLCPHFMEFITIVKISRKSI